MMKGADVIGVSGRLEAAADGVSGYDLFARHEGVIPAGQCRVVSAGVRIEGMPPGLIGHICGTRAMAEQGVLCMPLVIDGGHKGEIMLMFFNTGNVLLRIAQGACIGRLFFSLALHPQLVVEKG